MTSDELLRIVFDTIRTEMEPVGFVVRLKPKRKVPILIRDSPESLHLIWLFRDSLTRKEKLVVRLEFGVFSKVLGADDYPEALEKPMSCMWYFCHWVGYSNPDFHHPSENRTVATEAEAISTGREMLGFLRRFVLPRFGKLSDAAGMLEYFETERREACDSFKQKKQMDILRGHLMLKSIQLA